jgi:hypothetical protein
MRRVTNVKVEGSNKMMMKVIIGLYKPVNGNLRRREGSYLRVPFPSGILGSDIEGKGPEAGMRGVRCVDERVELHIVRIFYVCRWYLDIRGVFYAEVRPCVTRRGKK